MWGTRSATESDMMDVLAVHSGALGDVVLFAHLLLRVGGRRTLVAGGEKGRTLAGLGAVERAIDFDALPMGELFSEADLGECELPRLLGRHERLISCYPPSGRRGQLRLAAACGAGEAAFLPVRPPEGFGGHLLAFWSDLLGLAPQAAAGEPWGVPTEWRGAAGAALRAIGVAPGRPYVVLAPGAGSPAKCWPRERFVEVALRLEGARSAQGVFLVGPVECERWGGEALDALRRREPLLVSPPLSTLAGVLAGAEAALANDSGVGHLAGAVGTRTVSLFGPTRAEQFRPIGRSVTVLARPALEDIRVEEVLSALAAK